MDLGTARREYISTVDDPDKYRHVGLPEIEASRKSNEKGSEVHRLAEGNKPQLDAWSSMRVYEKMCGVVANWIVQMLGRPLVQM
jgi:hypothetical protein